MRGRSAGSLNSTNVSLTSSVLCTKLHNMIFITYQERSKPQRTLESEVIRSEEVVQELQEEVLPDPWELNNTARSDVELLFFNRVPKVGSQTFMELLRRLAIRNQFGMYLFIISFSSVIVVSSDGRLLLDIGLWQHTTTILCRLKPATPCASRPSL